MKDFGRPLQFGVSIDPSAAGFAEALALARQADKAGLDYLAVQDHPYQPGHLDVWTMLTYLLARTDRISALSDVIDLQLRPPTILAKAAASLASMAGGRLTLGVGGGASPQGIASMGGAPREGGAMVEFTEEAVRILRQALRGETVRTTTRHHQIAGYQAGPVPPRPVEVWLGSQKPRMLAATGRAGDGWICPLNIYVPPENVAALQARIDDAARGAGRDPGEVRRVYNVLGAIGPEHRGQGLSGTVGKWIDTLTVWAVELGFDTFVFWPTARPAAQLELFASEVVPAVREAVAERRGRS
ncbi:LLM class flavin-dependent oxidoreductase [Streptomyces sp. NPDC051217]|uniref:LLM class flavin-dependent oxidoreductase n=1 Tax=Streptomyces sp. NPDC051217 TaxID=3365644 RepID=UPI0037B3AC54